MKNSIIFQMPDRSEISFEDAWSDVQVESEYRRVVRLLRKESKLHPFVEWVLRNAIESAFPTRFRVSIHPEKYGISNGRIDLATYVSSRTIIHFELIATCKNGHVFRDTTSLLASTADERLAILIDEDVEPDVSKHFFKAIPNRQSEHIFLRDLLLEINRPRLIEIIRDLIGRAEFKNGSTDPSRFYCQIEGREIQIFEPIRVDYFNAPEGAILTLELQQHESMSKTVHLAGVRIADASGSVERVLPFVPNAPGEQYFVAAHLSTGELWRKRVFIKKSKEAPALTVEVGPYKPQSKVEFSVQNFPPNSILSVTVFQGNCGQGCNHGEEVSADGAGHAVGTFTLPDFICGERITGGMHRVSVSSRHGSPRADAEGKISIIGASEPTTLRRPTGQMTNNHFVSVAVRELVFAKRQLEIVHDVTNLSADTVQFTGISIMVMDRHGELNGLWTTKSPLHKLGQGSFGVAELAPGDQTSNRVSFVANEGPLGMNVGHQSQIKINWGFSLERLTGNPVMWSMEIAISLHEAEENTLLNPPEL